MQRPEEDPRSCVPCLFQQTNMCGGRGVHVENALFGRHALAVAALRSGRDSSASQADLHVFKATDPHRPRTPCNFTNMRNAQAAG